MFINQNPLLEAGQVFSGSTTANQNTITNNDTVWCAAFADEIVAVSSWYYLSASGVGNRRLWTKYSGNDASIENNYDLGVIAKNDGSDWNDFDILYTTSADTITTVTADTDPANIGNDNWFHQLLIFDSTQATSTDRIQLLINGSAMSITGTMPTLDSTIDAVISGGLNPYYIGFHIDGTKAFQGGCYQHAIFVGGAPAIGDVYDTVNNIPVPTGQILELPNLVSLNCVLPAPEVDITGGTVDEWSRSSSLVTAGLAFDIPR